MRRLTRIWLPLVPVVILAVFADHHATDLFYRFILSAYLVMIISVGLAVTIGVLVLSYHNRNRSGSA
jgi:L-cystine uptake protein TcyP (sodium:dicarboxylate symporter family)